MDGIKLLDYYRSINIQDDIVYNRRGTEENVKIKIILPLIEFLGYNIVKNVDLELQSIDIVLLNDNRKPILFIETKSWDEDIDKYLDQCLEYSFKLRIPFSVITSGQRMAIYSALLNSDNLNETNPLFQFNFYDLLTKKGEQILNDLYKLISKESTLNGYKNLYTEVEKSLVDIDIEKANKLFIKKCIKYKPVIKTKHITDEEFEKKALLHSPEVTIAVMYSKNEFVRLADTYNNFILRHGGKSVGIKYIDKSAPRQKLLGLAEIHPERAQIMFGTQHWDDLVKRKILTKKSIIDEIKKYDGDIQNVEDVELFINILEEAFENIDK